MNNILIQKAQPEDFPAIARLIASQNRQPATHCIQSDTGEDDQAIYQEMMDRHGTSQICFVTARQGDRLIGLLGSELDEESGRGWLRGPFVLAGTWAWAKVASALFQELLVLLPPAVQRLDSFLNVANEAGNHFYFGHGFHQVELVHVYLAYAPEQPLGLATPGEPLNPGWEQRFISLHNSIFPHTYATGARLLARLNETCGQVFVHRQNDDLIGYVYTSIDENMAEGVVEFVGVRAEARGRGIGRQLLQTALQWCFEVKKQGQVSLTVSDQLTGARSLYEKVGFTLQYTGVHTRFDLTDS